MSFSHSAAFEGITRMPQGLGGSQDSLTSHCLRLSDSPRKTQTQTHTRGLSMGPPPCVHRTRRLQQPLPKQTYGQQVAGQLSSSAGLRCTPPPLPPRAASAALLCRQDPRPDGRARVAVGARTASLATNAMAGDSRRCPTYSARSQHPRPPGPPSPAPIRAASARPAHPGSGRRGPRSRARAPPPSRRGF